MAVAGGKTYLADLLAIVAGSTQRPMCVLRRTAGAVASGGAALSWDIEDLDTHGWHSTSVNTSRITPLKAGWIRFTGTVHFTVNATGRRAAGIRMNGSTIYYGSMTPASSAGNLGVTVTATLPANGSTDYFEMFAFQDSGGSLNNVDPSSTRFEAEWLRDL